MSAAFRPHPLLRNPHLQTILPSKLRPTPKLHLQRERCELPDGDFLDLAWSGPRGAVQAILLHGLGGGFDSKYARGMALALHQLGIGTVQMQFRGAGSEPNRLDRSYHSGDTEDLAWLCDTLRQRDPQVRWLGIGWSLGGNVMLKYLGEQGDNCPLIGAAAVSVPFELQCGAERMSRGLSRVYQMHLLRELKAGLRRKFVGKTPPINLEQALQAGDFFAFDDACTAPLNGFSDARDYYQRCSSRHFLARIRRPTLIVHAADDPFMTPAVVPAAEELAPGVRLELSAHGGHVGFVCADRWGQPQLWLERRLPAFVRELASGVRLRNDQETVHE